MNWIDLLHRMCRFDYQLEQVGLTKAVFVIRNPVTNLEWRSCYRLDVSGVWVHYPRHRYRP